MQLALVREVRHVKGRAAAARVITMLGWDVNDMPLAALPPGALLLPGFDDVASWLAARCEHVDGQRTLSDVLYRDYVAWRAGETALSRENWGRVMTRIGYPGYVSCRTYRVGLVLKP